MTQRAAMSPPPRPASDVSAWTGMLGIAGLAVWIVFCHYWPTLVDWFHLSARRERLTGPSAALTGLVFAALPMVIYALKVEKVHLRPSTGIDWSHPRPVSAIVDISITKLAGLWATWTLIGGLYCIGRWYWDGAYLYAMHVLAWIAAPLFVLSIPYVLWLDRVLFEPRDPCWHFGALLVGRERFDLAKVWIHLRAWAVKGFFTAFMISIVPGGFAGFVGPDWGTPLANPVALANLLVTLMFVMDEQIGTVGYILTMKPLDAQIRSANPLLAGWLAALLCYPPFQIMGNGPVNYQSATADWSYWFADHPALLWLWGGALVALTAAYAWATFAFGIRFSNLTYRGVLTNGPYAFTRHPAYLSKNAFWWLSTLPFLTTTHSLVEAVRNTFFLALVSAIYYWRARTEEAHLLAEDPKYRAYWEWMEHHGAITARLARLWRGIVARRPEGVPHPAE